MEFIWDNSFTTGIEELDDQHYHLISLINTFGDFVQSGERSEEVVQIVFKELYDYTFYHFKEEEMLMELGGVHPEFVSLHLKSHHEFLSKINAIYEKVSSDESASAKQLYIFLVKWLTHHILGIDKCTTKQIAAVKDGHTPEEALDKFSKEINFHLKLDG